MVMGRVKHTIEGYTPHELSNLFVSFYPVGTTVRTDEYKTRPRIGVVGMYDSNGVLYELVNGKKSPVPGVNLWASMGEHVEPSGWTWRASWTFDIEPVNFTLRENETIDLSVVIMEDTPANNGELFRDVAIQVKKDSEDAVKSADSAKQSEKAAARSAKDSSASAYYSVNAANRATRAKIAAETASNQAISAANTSLNLSDEFNSLAESARLSESSASTHAQRSETAASTAVNSQLAAKVSQDAAKVSQDAAKVSQDAAKASQDAAKLSETNSATKATAAINAATQAETAAANAVAAAARLATDTIAISVNGAVGGTVNVNFPAGRFTAPPVVLVSRSTSGLAKYVPYVASVTPSGCVLGLYAGDGTTGSGSSTLSWIAVQTQS